MKQRLPTSEEYDDMVVTGTAFCDDLALITAKHLAKYPRAIRDRVLVMLQDQTSLYSPYTHDRMQHHLEKLDAKAG